MGMFLKKYLYEGLIAELFYDINRGKSGYFKRENIVMNSKLLHI